LGALLPPASGSGSSLRIGACSRAWVALVNAPVHVVRALQTDLSASGSATCWANWVMVSRSTPLIVPC
jgi:hypothetical protein